MASLNTRRKIERLEVEKLQGELTKVSLFGPISVTFGEHRNWADSIHNRWIEQQAFSKASACWGISSKFENDSIELMYWFESPNDAMLFKLMMSNYR